MNYKVIDVSKYQGNIDFGNVKESGVYGVIIRIGYRGYSSAGKIVLDPCFLQNVKMCEAVGLPWGVYFFSQAKNSAEGAEEAKFVIDTIRNNGFVPEFPIYIDSEKSTHPLGNGRADKISKADRTDAVYAFCE